LARSQQLQLYGRQIKKISPDTKIIVGEKATETAIKQSKTPSILHLATHSFFLPNRKKVNVTTNSFNKQLEKPKYLNLATTAIHLSPTR